LNISTDLNPHTYIN